MAKSKKSLERAMWEAEVHSRAFPDLTVWVLDMKGKTSGVYTVDWIVDDMVAQGWHIAGVFRNGVRVG